MNYFMNYLIRLAKGFLSLLLVSVTSLVLTVPALLWLAVYVPIQSVHDAIAMYRIKGIMGAILTVPLNLLFLLPHLLAFTIYQQPQIAIALLMVLPNPPARLLATYYAEMWRMGADSGVFQTVYHYTSRAIQNFTQMFNIQSLFQGRVVTSELIKRVFHLDPHIFAAEEPVNNPVFAPEVQALKITDAEWQILQLAHTPPLTEEELTQLEKLNEFKDNPNASKLENYKALITKLAAGCTILVESPTPANAILLVKQTREQNGSWKPIPGYTFLFDQSELATWFNRSANTLNPSNQQDILLRTNDTRYIWHPYYADPTNNPTAICQELDEATAHFRTYLNQNQTLNHTKPSSEQHKQMIEARLRVFARFFTPSTTQETGTPSPSHESNDRNFDSHSSHQNSKW